MIEVERVFPSPGLAEPQEVIGQLSDAQVGSLPFEAVVLDFIEDLSRSLRRHPGTRAEPAVAALAYGIRPASISRLKTDWEVLTVLDDQLIRVPRGVVFHIPPSNVDTLFVYSWLFSALMGNANIIRLSAGAITSTGVLLDVIASTLESHPAIADRTAVVTYGHDEEVTRELSKTNCRVVWGGDRTIETIRAVPLAPNATELAFADRFSMALLDATAVNGLDEQALLRLGQQFYNDAYWFDQLGCASPRLVIWLGDEAEVHLASLAFRSAVQLELDGRGHDTASSAVVSKLVYSANHAAEGSVLSVDWINNNMTVARLADLEAIPRDGPGGGLFFEGVISDLSELPSLFGEKDQTLTHFGLAKEQLLELAESLGGRGIDRIVPIGQALDFGRYWDGLDLFQSFTRIISVR